MKTYLVTACMIGAVMMAACGSESSDVPAAKDKIDYKLLPCHPTTNVESSSLALDSLCIYLPDEEILTSMVGQFFCLNDTILFADNQLASFLLFTTSGKFCGYRTSRGNGPNEVSGLWSAAPLPDGGFACTDENARISVFNDQWEKMRRTRIDWSTERTEEEQYNHPDPNKSDIYEVQFSSNRTRTLSDSILLVPIVTEHIRYNAYKDADHFYDNAYTIGIINTKSGKFEKMLCQHSPIYGQYKYIPNFQFILYDTYMDTLVFSFEADSMIYKMSLADGYTFAFGVAGKNMKTDYRETTNFESADDNMDDDRSTYGFYQSLDYVIETGTLFRSYCKKGYNKLSSLQVYKGTTLVSDYEHLPPRFKVFGYIAPYYYASAKPDYERETMVIYRFQLP